MYCPKNGKCVYNNQKLCGVHFCARNPCPYDNERAREIHAALLELKYVKKTSLIKQHIRALEAELERSTSPGRGWKHE